MEEQEKIEDKNQPPAIDKEQEPVMAAASEQAASEPKPQPKDMEVHTHAHTPRKKWSHYFWEFLMLFLAVFCGFLAEYKLEHVIEHQREATLMRSLVEDLRADEISLTNYAGWRTEVDHDFDTLLQVLSKPGSDSNAYAIYQESNSSVLRFGLPDIHEGTIQQLKNAGGLRLIRSKEVLNAINRHYLDITRMKSIYETEVLLRVRLTETMGEVLDARWLINKNNPPDSFRLATTDRAKINSYMNSILAARHINQRLINWLDGTRASTIELSQLIAREYHLQQPASEDHSKTP